MKTFKTVEIKVPNHIIQVELTLEEFHALADKENWSPILENDKTLIYIESNPDVLYYAKKKKYKFWAEKLASLEKRFISLDLLVETGRWWFECA